MPRSLPRPGSRGCPASLQTLCPQRRPATLITILIHSTLLSDDKPQQKASFLGKKFTWGSSWTAHVFSPRWGTIVPWCSDALSTQFQFLLPPGNHCFCYFFSLESYPPLPFHLAHNLPCPPSPPPCPVSCEVTSSGKPPLAWVCTCLHVSYNHFYLNISGI